MNAATELSQISDRLAEIAKAVTDEDDRSSSPAPTLRRASYLIEDAVSELMHRAAKQYRREIVQGSVRVLRERAI